MQNTNLPLDMSSLLGRDMEIRNIRRDLDESRLVTLTGPGGTGKTRLAKRVARSLVETFKAGVWFVDLTGVLKPEGVSGAVARELGLLEEPEIQMSETVARYLTDKQVLLVLDNCEQVLDGCANFAQILLTTAPDAKVLTTSREPLHVSGECVRQIPALSKENAVLLFLERSRQTNSDFTNDETSKLIVEEITQRLDGIPLAVELAAARIRLMSPAQILAGLEERFDLLTSGVRDATAHHKSLRASIAWSYDLMEPDERELANRLCVLQGFTLDAAQSLGSEIDSKVLDLLQRLVDMSMLQVDRSDVEPRFRFLESVRHFLLQKLETAGNLDIARASHLSYFIDFAEKRAPSLIFGEGPSLLSEIKTEFDNLEDALIYADGLSNSGKLLRLLTALTGYYELRGQFQHGIRWFNRAFATDPAPDILLARALWGSAHVCAYGGRMDLAYPQALKAVELAQTLGDVWTEARAFDVIGFGQSASQPELAKETLEKCVALGTSIKDDWAMSHGKKMTTAIYMFSHDHEGAVLPISDLVTCSKLFDSRYLLAWAKALTGYFARDMGEFEEAEKTLNMSIENSSLVGDPATGGFAMAWSAGLKADMGHIDVAREELQNLMATASITGTFLAVPEAMFILGSIEAAEGNYAEALQLVEPQIIGLRNAGIPSWSEQLALVAATAHIALGNYTKADVLLDEAEQQTAPLNNPLINGLIHFTRGRHALARNDTGEAEMHLYKAAAVQLAGELKPGLMRTSETIAEILVKKEKFSDSARVLAVVDRERADMPLVRGKVERSEHAALIEKIEQALDPDTLADIRASAARASLNEVVESISRMRGQRARPLTGWTSLTPTENRVVSLVTEGLSNPQIAARMFIARGTVKIHISHIFDKLDVKSRTQLATKAITDGFENLDT